MAINLNRIAKGYGAGSPPISSGEAARRLTALAEATGYKMTPREIALLEKQSGNATASVHQIEQAEPDLAEAMALAAGEPLPETMRLGGRELTRQSPRMKTVRKMIPPVVACWQKRPAGEMNAAFFSFVIDEISATGDRGAELIGDLVSDVYSLELSGRDAFEWLDNLKCDEAADALRGVVEAIPFAKLLGSFTAAMQPSR